MENIDTSVPSILYIQNQSETDIYKMIVDYNKSLRSDCSTFEKQFSKGIDRLRSWLLLYQTNISWNPYTNPHGCYESTFADLTDKERIFCLTALLITYQVFGDGNHRTAYHFYEKHTGYAISERLKQNINDFYRYHDYTTIKVNSDLINKLKGLGY